MESLTPVVYILKTLQSGDQVRAGAYVFLDSQIHLLPLLESEAGWIEDLHREISTFGIRYDSGVGRRFPKDGMAFLEALQIAFDGIYVRATAIEWRDR